jgi:hypothetical protein
LHAQPAPFSSLSLSLSLSLADARFVYSDDDDEQAALPQGIVPFVFAKEYGVHPDILSTA